MATNVAKGTLTQPGATGNVTISLSSNFDPRVIIVWGCTLTADGDSTSAREAELSYGVGTYRSSTVSQWFVMGASESGDQTVPHNAKNANNDAIMRFFGANDLDATGTIDCELALVSMSTGGTSNVVLNWVNLHATASIVIHYLIIGGSDVTDALCGMVNGTAGATTVDTTVVAGFGKPDLLCLASDWDTTGVLINSGANNSIGWGTDSTNQFCSVYAGTDGTATEDMLFYQRSGFIIQTLNPSAGLADYDVTLAVKSAWPTDGFRTTWSAAQTDKFYWLAFKAPSMNKTVGALSTATATGAQDTALGYIPSGVLWWGGNLPPSASLNTTHADLVEYHVGGSDGTNHGDAGVSYDDGNANQRGRMHQSTSAIRLVSNAGGVITTINTGTPSFSGTNWRVNWATAAAAAREVLYVAFGSPPVAAATIPDLLMPLRLIS